MVVLGGRAFSYEGDTPYIAFFRARDLGTGLRLRVHGLHFEVWYVAFPGLIFQSRFWA